MRRKKRHIEDLLDGREKHRPMSEERIKLAEMKDTLVCKTANSLTFQVICLADVYSTVYLRRQ